MAKIELDKYYTPKEIARHCYEKVIEILGRENIIEIIEPSAGSGVFLDLDKSIIGYDIEPEDDRIIKQDYLLLDTLGDDNTYYYFSNLKDTSDVIVFKDEDTNFVSLEDKHELNY